MPKLLLSPLGKIVAAIVLAGFCVTAVNVWLGKRDAAAFKRGVAQVEAQVRAATDRANKAERALELSMSTTKTLIDQRAVAQGAALTIKLEPMQKDLIREVQTDVGARCRVADGVLNSLAAQRSAANASIAASNPGRP